MRLPIGIGVRAATSCASPRETLVQAAFRMSALAFRPGRSRCAACVRAFATRGCARGGLLGWASGEAGPSDWPPVAGVLADCLSAHRETSRPNLSLVHSSRGRNARTHKQPSPVGAKSRGQSARKHTTTPSQIQRACARSATSSPAASAGSTTSGDGRVVRKSSRLTPLHALIFRPSRASLCATRRRRGSRRSNDRD